MQCEAEGRYVAEVGTLADAVASRTRRRAFQRTSHGRGKHRYHPTFAPI